MRSRRSLLLLALAAGVEACKKRAFSCTNTSGLSPDDVQVRANVAYADVSTDEARTCDKCQHFIAQTECGGCKLVKGPIHPRGTCKAFVLKL